MTSTEDNLVRGMDVTTRGAYRKQFLGELNKEDITQARIRTMYADLDFVNAHQ